MCDVSTACDPASSDLEMPLSEWFTSSTLLVISTIALLTYTYLTWHHLVPYFRNFGLFIRRRWHQRHDSEVHQETSPYDNFVPLNRRSKTSTHRSPPSKMANDTGTISSRNVVYLTQGSNNQPSAAVAITRDTRKRHGTPSQELICSLQNRMEHWIKDRDNQNEMPHEIQKHPNQPAHDIYEVKPVPVSNSNYDLFPCESKILAFPFEYKQDQYAISQNTSYDNKQPKMISPQKVLGCTNPSSSSSSNTSNAPSTQQESKSSNSDSSGVQTLYDNTSSDGAAKIPPEWIKCITKKALNTFQNLNDEKEGIESPPTSDSEPLEKPCSPLPESMPIVKWSEMPSEDLFPSESNASALLIDEPSMFEIVKLCM